MSDNDSVNILMVDDQPAKLLTYETMLGDLGENLLRAGSAREALDQLLRNDIAVVLIDVVMPELDGFELAAMIREHPRFRKTAVILVSAILVSDVDRMKGYHSGAVDYVPVPVIPEVLRAKVMVFVDLYRKNRRLELMNEELERRVDERTADLSALAASLRQSEERFRLATAAAGTFVFEVDLAQSNDAVVPGLEQIVGVAPGTVTPSIAWWHTRLHPEDKETHLERVARDVAKGGVSRSSYRVRHEDGSWLWVDVARQVVVDAAGTPIRMIGALHDVTQRMAAEQSLREADRRKDEFIAMLAHELRNPLAPLANSSHVLRWASEVTRRDHALDVIDRQLSHMVRLVDDLLDVGRLTTGKLDLRAQPVELAQVIQHAVETVQPYVERGSHTLSVELPVETIWLDADPTRLAQVFGNLLHNACKFTEPDGRGHISLAAVPQGSDVVVTVRDNGIGIPPELLSSVFDIFKQGDRSLEKTTSGLGIGLTMAKHLAERHGARIEAHSEVGRGSEFIVRLPMRPAPLPGALEPRLTADPWHPSVKRRVLVADDNADSLESLGLVLELMGHDVRLAHDGAEAVTLAETFRPQAVLLDIGMPNLNGFDACRQIREAAWGQDMHLIALTGWSQDEDRERSTAAGFDHHLVKPISPAALASLLEIGVKTTAPSVGADA
ncbi:MAG: hybrid sensor histidine kinase/response regulator [Gemmatimonadaceae bacterium]